MKNKMKLFGIIALVAVVGLMIASCGPDDDSSIRWVRAKYLLSGDPNSSAGRSVLPNRSVARNASGDIEGAEKLEELYTKIGAYKGSITPTIFELAFGGLNLWKVYEEKPVQDGVPIGANDPLILAHGGVLDLAKPIVVSSIDVEPGIYQSVVFAFSLSGLNQWESKISFPAPDGYNYETHVFNTAYNEISYNDGIITCRPYLFEPYFINSAASRHNYAEENLLGSNDALGSISWLFMGGNTYKVFNAVSSNIKANTYLPGVPDIYLLTHPNELNILVPFEGITVPENASAVRFEIYWDIDGIIEYYEGPTDSPDDDIFILKNKFWEDFSIKAFIE